MRYFARLLAVAYAVLIWPVSAAITAVERFAWPDFRPDARTSIDLDRVVHALDAKQPARSSRFSAFVDRVRDHARFIGGAFRIDPGRMPA